MNRKIVKTVRRVSPGIKTPRGFKWLLNKQPTKILVGRRSFKLSIQFMLKNAGSHEQRTDLYARMSEALKMVLMCNRDLQEYPL